MSSETRYSLDCNTLLIPQGIGLNPFGQIMHGELTLKLDCAWPSNVPQRAQRIWYIVDGPRDISVVTEYRDLDGETILRRDAALLAKPTIPPLFSSTNLP